VRSTSRSETKEDSQVTEAPTFHLAWCKHFANLFAASPVRNNLVYALVPAGAGGFVGAMRLQTCTECGRPGDVIYATQYDLLSLRRPDLRPGTEDPTERQLIETLRGRALSASYVLPTLIATTAMPGWSKLPLPGALVQALRSAGGGGPAVHPGKEVRP
jgi:hypothetical protein